MRRRRRRPDPSRRKALAAAETGGVGHGGRVPAAYRRRRRRRKTDSDSGSDSPARAIMMIPPSHSRPARPACRQVGTGTMPGRAGPGPPRFPRAPAQAVPARRLRLAASDCPGTSPIPAAAAPSESDHGAWRQCCPPGGRHGCRDSDDRRRHGVAASPGGPRAPSRASFKFRPGPQARRRLGRPSESSWTGLTRI